MYRVRAGACLLEFLVVGATAVQLGTVNFYNPRASMEVLDALPGALTTAGASRIADIVGTLTVPRNNEDKERGRRGD